MPTHLYGVFPPPTPSHGRVHAGGRARPPSPPFPMRRVDIVMSGSTRERERERSGNATSIKKGKRGRGGGGGTPTAPFTDALSTELTTRAPYAQHEKAKKREKNRKVEASCVTVRKHKTGESGARGMRRRRGRRRTFSPSHTCAAYTRGAHTDTERET